MSVKLALAKLCACALGGAVIGAGALHSVSPAKQRPYMTKFAKQKPVMTKKPVRKRVAYKAPKKRLVKRINRTVTTTTTYGDPITTVTREPGPVYAGGGGGVFLFMVKAGLGAS